MSERTHIVGECQDCKWWENRARLTHGWATCSLLSDHDAVKLKVVAYWHGDINTAPDFGCLLCEAKT